jgi:hypothetical protein
MPARVRTERTIQGERREGGEGSGLLFQILGGEGFKVLGEKQTDSQTQDEHVDAG